MENEFNSERPKYDTLVYYFTCSQFDPTCLLCENFFPISKVAEKKFKVHSFVRESRLDWHVGECIHAVCSCKISFHMVSLSQNAVKLLI